jgi:hypothetical protein
MTIPKFVELAKSFPDVEEQKHFEKRAFKIKKKRIFCTLDDKDKKATVKLSAVDQSVYTQIDPAIIYPVPNKWGKQGWTFVELPKITVTLMREILETAYQYALVKGVRN